MQCNQALPSDQWYWPHLCYEIFEPEKPYRRPWVALKGTKIRESWLPDMPAITQSLDLQKKSLEQRSIFGVKESFHLSLDSMVEDPLFDL
jgi:hypothetical protein